MTSKNYRKVAAGHLSYEDVISHDAIYITGTDQFFTDSSIETKYGHIYDKGRVLRAPAVRAYQDMLEEDGNPKGHLVLDHVSNPDKLFDKLIDVSGIGPQSAVMLTIALTGKCPDVKRVLAADLHHTLFVEYETPNYAREDQISSFISVKNAKQSAMVGAIELLKGVKLKDKPTADELATATLDPRMTKCFEDGVGDLRLMEAEWNFRKYLSETVDPLQTTIPNTYFERMFDDQQEAFRHLVESDRKISLMQGGPGSGKSYIITALVSLWREAHGETPLVVSYTNKACLNLKERLPDYEFVALKTKTVPTINSAHFRLAAGNENVLRKTTLIIVDESSMVSSSVLAMLMDLIDAAAPNCRMIMVGDVNQLPPVCQYGTPFRNSLTKLKSIVDYVELSGFHRSNGAGIYEMFRQFRESGNHTIRPNGDDVTTMTVGDIDSAKAIVATQYQLLGTETLGCVAETNRMKDAINLETVCKLYNLSEDEVLKVTPYRTVVTVPLLIGVRVVAIANNKPLDNLSNSEFGTIKDVKATRVLVEMDIGKRTIDVPMKDFVSTFELGYCTTVHKYQGSEKDEIIYVLENSANLRGNSFFAAKEIKYVGLSRAKCRIDVLAIESGTSGVLKDKDIELHVNPSEESKMLLDYYPTIDIK